MQEGKFNDLTRNWYLKVGAPIALTLCINIFVPHIAIWLEPFLKNLKYKLKNPKSIFTISQADAFYKRPEFNIAIR